uniref:Uracil-DNA glycosylase-like domain-containing protein n=1 Tax=viral metagenome TaxID=1070528 RepID=A0A6C0AZS9_9ZZZZ
MESIHKSWYPLFKTHEINLDELYNDSTVIYPPRNDIFKVFSMDVCEIRLLILGQDPYHNEGQAHGLSFSVPHGVKTPPSLRNIFKELQNEFPERGYTFYSGNLERWFQEENIFLLNASLTVIKNKPASHMKIWNNFTNDVIQYVSKNNPECVYLLLGNFAKSKKQLIFNSDRVIEGIHPSPLSASRGFFYSNIFKQVEEKIGYQINWSI